MRKVFLVLIAFVHSLPLYADQVSVKEFVSGTTISSADMNSNFDALVAESNEQDQRISDLESYGSPSAPEVPPVPRWIDAEGNELGFYLGQPPQSQPSVFVKLPETDLLLSESYYIDTSDRVNYRGGGVLSFPLRGCEGTPLLWTTLQGRNIPSFGVTLDGFYVYPGENVPGIFERLSYVAVDYLSGEISCKNEGGPRDINVTTAVISSKPYINNVKTPVSLRWR